jgi:hypothetical protein
MAYDGRGNAVVKSAVRTVDAIATATGVCA